MGGTTQNWINLNPYSTKKQQQQQKQNKQKSNVPYRTLFHKTIEFRMNPKRLLIIQFDDQSTLNCQYIPSHDGTNENL